MLASRVSEHFSCPQILSFLLCYTLLWPEGGSYCFFFVSIELLGNTVGMQSSEYSFHYRFQLDDFKDINDQIR